MREEKRHPVYNGVRKRQWGRWVTEVRVPKTKSRIWLGSFPTAEMAARAYDVAVFCLRGEKALLNFPHLVDVLPRPFSTTPKDIREAALAAAAMELPAVGCEGIANRSWFDQRKQKSADVDIKRADQEEGKDIYGEIDDDLAWWNSSDDLVIETERNYFSWPLCSDELCLDKSEFTLWVSNP